MWPLIGSGKFSINLANVDRDVLRIEEYYRANGYLDVRVTRELTFTPDLHLVDVTFHIAEGQRYRVQGVRLEGCKMFPPEDLRPCIRLKRGDFYDERVIDSDMRRITDHYNWRGYTVKVEKEQIYSTEEPASVFIQYTLTETPPTRVGNPHLEHLLAAMH